MKPHFLLFLILVFGVSCFFMGSAFRGVSESIERHEQSPWVEVEYPPSDVGVWPQGSKAIMKFEDAMKCRFPIGTTIRFWLGTYLSTQGNTMFKGVESSREKHARPNKKPKS